MMLITPTLTQALTTEQQQYLDARASLDSNKLTLYQAQRQQLGDYPLAVYLDFHHSINQLLSLPGKQAAQAFLAFKNTPLYNTARARYLVRSGRKKQWDDFLAVSPNKPNNIELQCYFYRAQLQKGDKALAYKGASKLWLYGRSRPKECDPLFKAWKKAGFQTQEMIWSRMRLSFEQGQYGLLSYLSRQFTLDRTAAKRLVDVYKDPRRLRHLSRYKGNANVMGEIVDLGLRRLAKKDLKQAVKLYAKYQQSSRFSDFQGRQLSRYLVRRALIYQTPELQSFVDTMLPLLDSDDLIEMRLRWALKDDDQSAFKRFLPLLSQQAKETSRWTFWRARVLQSGNKKQQQQAKVLLSSLSQQRNFYGFAAASMLALPYQVQHQSTPVIQQHQKQLTADAGLARVAELLAIDKQSDARAEWNMLLNRHSPELQQAYGVYASSQNWHSLGVQASIKAKLWNDMDLRFPYPEQTAFTQASKKYRVDINEIRAIARRESAYYPNATSGVGARGYMQLMPATAKQTAKQAKLNYLGIKSLYDNELNIALGSAYYASLLQRFHHNRVLATASYNAGPSRVKIWLKQSQSKLDAMSFIESIPYRETREYVQAVLSYRVIYQIKQKLPPELLSNDELRFKY